MTFIIYNASLCLHPFTIIVFARLNMQQQQTIVYIQLFMYLQVGSPITAPANSNHAIIKCLTLMIKH